MSLVQVTSVFTTLKNSFCPRQEFLITVIIITIFLIRIFSTVMIIRITCCLPYIVAISLHTGGLECDEPETKLFWPLQGH